MIQVEQALLDTFKSRKEVTSNLEILKLLTYQRVLNPGSKLYTQQRQNELFGQWQIDENKMYRSLKRLASAKENIQLQAHEGIKGNVGRVSTLVFYDVTNYYFEIDFSDPDYTDETTGEIIEGFRKLGPCKHNSGNPIVQLGLFMDANGIPISYKLFKGNTTDPKTYLPAIKQVKKTVWIRTHHRRR